MVRVLPGGGKAIFIDRPKGSRTISNRWRSIAKASDLSRSERERGPSLGMKSKSCPILQQNLVSIPNMHTTHDWQVDLLLSTNCNVQFAVETGETVPSSTSHLQFPSGKWPRQLQKLLAKVGVELDVLSLYLPTKHPLLVILQLSRPRLGAPLQKTKHA